MTQIVSACMRRLYVDVLPAENSSDFWSFSPHPIKLISHPFLGHANSRTVTRRSKVPCPYFLASNIKEFSTLGRGSGHQDKFCLMGVVMNPSSICGVSPEAYIWIWHPQLKGGLWAIVEQFEILGLALKVSNSLKSCRHFSSSDTYYYCKRCRIGGFLFYWFVNLIIDLKLKSENYYSYPSNNPSNKPSLF